MKTCPFVPGAAAICFAVLMALPLPAGATSTINATNTFAWGANIGWTNWRPSVADGVAIGEFVCSGYVWAANVGWINLGSGLPANNIQYGNNSATDYGVNYSLDPAQPGVAILRGYAYGANVGWIQFEAQGNPRLSLFTGTFGGYVYSANCGWISLNESVARVQTDSVAMGADSNGNGIADAWEFLHYGALLAPGGQNTDPFGTGQTNLQHYAAGTNPTLANAALRITSFTTTGAGLNSLLTWTSNTGRLYTIESTTSLLLPWTVDPTFGAAFAPDAGATTTRQVPGTAAPQRFFRIQAVRPLP